MSYPINPLDTYQSYSYHHFLIASNNTEVLRQIEEQEIPFNSLARLKHGETVDGGEGSVVMILNSAVDSKFYIESLNYSCMYVNVSDATAPMTQATEMEMIVKETGGATFINFLRDVSDTKLQTSYDSICFMLKTFFVGHRADGTTSTYPCAPITILMKDMDSSFDFSGGVHNIKMLGMTNGAPLHNDHMHYVNRNLNLVTRPNSVLLKDLITDLETKLNAQLEEQWKIVSAGGQGRKVKYKFTIPKDWENYKVKSTSKDNYIERLFEKEKQAVKADEDAKKTQGQQNKPGIEADRTKTAVNVSMKTTVTQILSEIFKHCDEIQAALVGNQKLTGANQQLAQLHQVVSSITSDKEVMTIHFDIINYYLPKLESQDKKSDVEIKSETEAKNNADFDAYGITFDYIFTGKNSDILQLDMKANHTNVILIGNQEGVQKATGNMTSTDKSVQGASDDQKIIKTVDKEFNPIKPLRKFDAVYLPETPVDAQHGYIYAAPDSAKLRAKYVNLLALLAANSQTNMHIVVRGNPVFLNQMVRPLFPHNDTDYEKKVVEYADKAKANALKGKGDHDATKSTSLMGQSPNHIPQFVKVNIMTPTFDENGNVTGYEKFWYQGRYRITSIKNHFVGGQFTQELYLLPYELEGQT